MASDIKILHMATDRLKDAVSSSLRLTEDGQNVCFLPEWMSEAQLTEATAERRGTKGWDKRPGMVRNETLDHLVQARAMHIISKGEKVNPDAPPGWAALGPENTNAVLLSEVTAAKTVGGVGTAPARPKRSRRAGRLF